MANAFAFDIHIECKAEGTGTGLLLIHGTGQNADNTWSQIVPELSDNHMVVQPNYSGSGKTESNGHNISLSLLTNQMLAVADHFNLDKFTVVGHSLGCCVAMQLAFEHPARIDKLVLLAGFASSADARMQLQFQLWRNLALHNSRSLAEIFLLTAFSPEFIRALDIETMNRLVDDIHKSTNWEGCAKQIDLDLEIDISENLKSIPHRALVIGCKKDFIVPKEHTKKLVQELPNAVYEELDSGHAGVGEQPTAFVKLLKGFI